MTLSILSIAIALGLMGEWAMQRHLELLGIGLWMSLIPLIAYSSSRLSPHFSPVSQNQGRAR
jgi:hypothetical protein